MGSSWPRNSTRSGFRMQLRQGEGEGGEAEAKAESEAEFEGEQEIENHCDKENKTFLICEFRKQK